MSAKKHYFNTIARTLALNFDPSLGEAVRTAFPENQSNWQLWVRMGNDHLVLQTLYLTLQQNDLLTNLPDDLTDYLKSLYDLNKERNTNILEQATFVRNVLEKEGIDCLFLKGVANLLDGLYSDIGERIMYDIDILVEKNELLKSVRVLLDHGYIQKSPFIPDALLSTMHYPVLVKEGFKCGLEIHHMPVKYNYLDGFNTEMVMRDKRYSSGTHKEYLVMSDEHKIIHNFIHSQLMHNRHYTGNVSLRDMYDLLLLGQRENLYHTFVNFKSYREKSLPYLKLAYRYFNVPVPPELADYKKGKFFFYRHELNFRLNRKKLKVLYFMILFLQKYLILPFTALFNPHARNYVFSRLKRPGWYSHHLRIYWRRISRKRDV